MVESSLRAIVTWHGTKEEFIFERVVERSTDFETDHETLLEESCQRSYHLDRK